MSDINIRITKTVNLSAEELKAVPPVSYYEHGSEWESITITYDYDLVTGAWSVLSARGSLWRLTAKGARVKNSLQGGNYPRLSSDLYTKYMPTEKVSVEVGA